MRNLIAFIRPRDDAERMGWKLFLGGAAMVAAQFITG